MNLEDVLREAATAIAEVESATEPGGALVWSRAGHPFAALGDIGTAAEFGLDPAVAAAAVRTPDVAPSTRGPGWVRFSPKVLDGHGVDRAEAWFASAYRRALRG
jgi:hypothetical protein